MEILENMEVLFKRASKEPTKIVIHNKRWVIKATLEKRVDKPQILKLTIRRGQSTFSDVFIF